MSSSLENLDKKPYGVDLAQKVAIRLRKRDLYFSHRDYCGTGFFYKDDAFYYCEFQDGFRDKVLQEFKNEATFVNWLSQQSDWTLSRQDENKGSFIEGNQTITRDRLVAFIRRPAK